VVSVENAEALKELAASLPCQGIVDKVLLDPASSARTSIGMAARGEYESVFGSRFVDMWPLRKVGDSLDQLEILVGTPKREADLYVHPRCLNLIAAMKEYKHAMKRGEVLDGPEPLQHPHGDMVDALRGFVGFALPDGHRPKPKFIYRKPQDVFG
jgi:hypothetical protein